MTGRDAAGDGRVLVALIGGQIALHSCMAGIRMAAPLASLRAGDPAWVVGVLLGLFAAAPIIGAIQAGRLADRRGYHWPIRLAVALAFAGGALAVISALVPWLRLPALGLAAALCGAGANIGMIVIQRTAGGMTTDATEQKRIFSWLGIAPAIAGVIGPVVAGTLIDAGGFAVAFAALTLLTLATLGFARRVPVEAPAVAAGAKAQHGAFDLLAVPGFGRLLLVNWLIASTWDIHSFLVPVLGHERGFSASAIGLVLGIFASAVVAVRLLVPVLAHRLREGPVLVATMLACGAVFAVYPFATTAWQMAIGSTVLGLALGAVQPMVMTVLMQITPRQRHGEAIALRSMAINLSSAVMPLAFGFVGAALGSSMLFWLMGAAVASGSVVAKRVGELSSTQVRNAP